ncbi:MAG: hypothetical protein ACJ8GN_28360 [Longimicrobiaceae bacterium]
MSTAPMVDAALAGRIGWRDEVRSHLRAIEQEARALKDEIEVSLLTGGTDDSRLRTAADELGRVLGDPASPLLRALARRPRDLEAAASGRKSLDARWARVRHRARNALERYEQAAALRKALARLHARFGERLPWHLNRALERARITAADADRPDAVSIAARVQRLERIERELEARSDELPLRAEPPAEVVDWPEEVSGEELAAAMAAAAGDAGPDAAAWRARSRTLAAAHATRLLGTGSPASRGDPAAAAAREVVSLVQAGVHPGAEDVDAWGIALRAAARDRSPGGGAPAEEGPREPETGSLLFVVPLFDRFVLVRTGRPWPVRVDARAVRCGAPVRVVAALPPGTDGTPLPVERWAEPLFDLPDDPAAEWLVTSRPAEILPFARIGTDRWLATVEERGALAPAGEPAWGAAPRRREPVVRVLPGAELTPGEGVLPAGPPTRTETGMFGWRTDAVPVPLADVPAAWLRSAESPAGRDHVEAEQRFFLSAGLRVSGCTPRCLGRAREGGYLYAPPLAFRTEESPPLRAWERDDPLAFVTAAARLWLRLREAGLALGFYHPATLGFRVLFGRRDAGGAPVEAVAVAAPLGTRLGANYRRSKESLRLFPAYERLGARLPPAQLEGEVAMPETEAAALALYALDRLLTVPLDLPAGAPWDEFVDMVAAARSRASAPYTIERLTSVIGSPDELKRAFEAVAAGSLP